MKKMYSVFLKRKIINLTSLVILCSSISLEAAEIDISEDTEGLKKSNLFMNEPSTIENILNVFNNPRHIQSVNYLIPTWNHEDSTAQMKAKGSGFMIRSMIDLDIVDIGIIGYYANTDELDLTFKSFDYGTTTFNEMNITSYGICTTLDYYYPFFQSFIAFASGGIGLNNLSIDFSSIGGIDDSGWSFSYYLGLGLIYEVNDKYGIQCGYSNFGINNSIPNADDWNLSSVSIGIINRF